MLFCLHIHLMCSSDFLAGATVVLPSILIGIGLTVSWNIISADPLKMSLFGQIKLLALMQNRKTPNETLYVERLESQLSISSPTDFEVLQ